MSYNESTEMYLETIYILENDHGHAHVVDIAKRLGVTKPSVSKAMKLLKEQGLINKEAYGSITLTGEGRKISCSIYDKHRLIADFLEASLGLDPADAAENACAMEHVVTAGMIEAIEDFLKQHPGN